MQASIPVVTTNKRRTITLTNQAPIRIVEDEWPVIAQGVHGADLSSEPFGSEIAIRVRRENKPPGRFIIHASYRCRDEIDDERSQAVRVGRLLDAHDAGVDLEAHILAVGQELRERIDDEDARRNVIHALDGCFADLGPREL
jgi:hypothetical protein